MCYSKYIHIYVAMYVYALFINAVISLNNSTNNCEPECNLGQCCQQRKCMCLNTTTLEVKECKCKSLLLYMYIITYVYVHIMYVVYDTDPHT